MRRLFIANIIGFIACLSSYAQQTIYLRPHPISENVDHQKTINYINTMVEKEIDAIKTNHIILLNKYLSPPDAMLKSDDLDDFHSNGVDFVFDIAFYTHAFNGATVTCRSTSTNKYSDVFVMDKSLDIQWLQETIVALLDTQKLQGLSSNTSPPGKHPQYPQENVIFEKQYLYKDKNIDEMTEDQAFQIDENDLTFSIKARKIQIFVSCKGMPLQAALDILRNQETIHNYSLRKEREGADLTLSLDLKIEDIDGNLARSTCSFAIERLNAITETSHRITSHAVNMYSFKADQEKKNLILERSLKRATSRISKEINTLVTKEFHPNLL